MSTITPGPWRVDTWKYSNPDREVLTIQTESDAVAQALDLWPPDARQAERDANARAIAALPLLIEALRDLVRRVDTTPIEDGSNLDTCAAHAALQMVEEGNDGST